MAGRKQGITMGTGVVSGMTISTLIGLFLIPVCYVFVQKFSDRRKRPNRNSRPPTPTRTELLEDVI